MARKQKVIFERLTRFNIVIVFSLDNQTNRHIMDHFLTNFICTVITNFQNSKNRSSINSAALVLLPILELVVSLNELAHLLHLGVDIEEEPVLRIRFCALPDHQTVDIHPGDLTLKGFLDTTHARKCLSGLDIICTQFIEILGCKGKMDIAIVVKQRKTVVCQR